MNITGFQTYFHLTLIFLQFFVNHNIFDQVLFESCFALKQIEASTDSTKTSQKSKTFIENGEILNSSFMTFRFHQSSFFLRFFMHPDTPKPC